jgi:hypothetical protein
LSHLQLVTPQAHAEPDAAGIARKQSVSLTMVRVLNSHEGDWSKLPNEKLHDRPAFLTKYHSGNPIKDVQIGRACGMWGIDSIFCFGVSISAKQINWKT